MATKKQISGKKKRARAVPAVREVTIGEAIECINEFEEDLRPIPFQLRRHQSSQSFSGIVRPILSFMDGKKEAKAFSVST